MKILLLGKDGQVGWELQRALAPIGEIRALGRDAVDGVGDLARPDAIVRNINCLKPDVIVNAAAYTAVDRAEEETATAELINAFAPTKIAHAARDAGSLLVHFSTDYVFDGSGDRPWVETDPTGPLNAYGRSKLHGERNIIVSGCDYLIFRTSWVYARQGRNFIHTMLELMEQKSALTVVNDQIGAPTGASLIADITAHVIGAVRAAPKIGGIYHLAAKGAVSWLDYARFIQAERKVADPGWKGAACILEPVNSAQFAKKALRPHNSRLCCDKLETEFKLRLPSWQDGVGQVVAEIQ